MPRAFALLLALACGVGAVREVFFHLIYEPLRVPRAGRIGSEFESIRPLLSGAPRIGYLSDQSLDSDPAKARSSPIGDRMYAEAQFALAPTVLAFGDASLALALAVYKDPAQLRRLLASDRYTVLAQPRPTVALLQRR